MHTREMVSSISLRYYFPRHVGMFPLNFGVKRTANEVSPATSEPTPRSVAARRVYYTRAGMEFFHRRKAASPPSPPSLLTTAHVCPAAFWQQRPSQKEATRRDGKLGGLKTF